MLLMNEEMGGDMSPHRCVRPSPSDALQATTWTSTIAGNDEETGNTNGTVDVR